MGGRVGQSRVAMGNFMWQPKDQGGRAGYARAQAACRSKPGPAMGHMTERGLGLKHLPALPSYMMLGFQHALSLWCAVL